MEDLCSELNIILYIEKELPEAEMLRMESHFARCGNCRKLLADHRLIRIALLQASQVEIPDNFAASVMLRLPTPFHTFLHSARERVIATAATIVFGTIGVFSWLVGSRAPNLGQLSSIQWWSALLLQILSVVTDGFRLVLNVVRLLTALGVFFLQGLSFILGSLAQLILFSPHGLILVLLTVMFFLSSGCWALWKYHPESIRVLRPIPGGPRWPHPPKR